MLDFPLHFPGTNATLPWTQTEMSAAVVLVALTVVMLTCCGAAALVMVACCGGRRRDAVGESGDSRWLPGVGVIDYVPTSSRSSIRVSLALSESTDGPSEDPTTTSTQLRDTAESNSSISLIMGDAEIGLLPSFPSSSPPRSSSSVITLPSVFEEAEPTDSSGISLTLEHPDTIQNNCASRYDPLALDSKKHSFAMPEEALKKIVDSCDDNNSELSLDLDHAVARSQESSQSKLVQVHEPLECDDGSKCYEPSFVLGDDGTADPSTYNSKADSSVVNSDKHSSDDCSLNNAENGNGSTIATKAETLDSSVNFQMSEPLHELYQKGIS